MGNDWIDNELKTVNLNDKRLDKRFSEVLKALSERPNVSIRRVKIGTIDTMGKPLGESVEVRSCCVTIDEPAVVMPGRVSHRRVAGADDLSFGTEHAGRKL